MITTELGKRSFDYAKARQWTGWVTWGLTVPFLAMDAAMHLANPAPVADASKQLGLPAGFAQAIGIVQLVCLALYVVPRTAALGALLLVGYLGGAVATQARIGGPAWFAVLIGALLCLSLYCRDERVRGLFQGDR